MGQERAEKRKEEEEEEEAKSRVDSVKFQDQDMIN